MRLHWAPEPADWTDAVRVMVPFTRWVGWFSAALMVLSVVLVAIGQTLPGVFGAVCAVVIFLLPSFGARRSFRRNPVAGRKITAEVADGRIALMTVDGTAYTELTVSELAGWSETERSFVLRTDTGGVHPVPGRAFASVEEIDAFRDLLTEALGKPLR